MYQALTEAIAVANGLAAQPRTCHGCRHWHEQPRPKIMTPDGPAVDMGAPLSGTCQEHLHSQVIQGPQGAGFTVYYPQVPATFPACGRWEERPHAGG